MLPPSRYLTGRSHSVSLLQQHLSRIYGLGIILLRRMRTMTWRVPSYLTIDAPETWLRNRAIIFSETQGNTQTVTHVAIQLPSTPLVPLESPNATTVVCVGPETEFEQLVEQTHPSIFQDASYSPDPSVMPNSSLSNLEVYQEIINPNRLESQISTPLTSHQSNTSSCAIVTQTLLGYAGIAASLYVIKLVMRRDTKPGTQARVQERSAPKSRRVRRNRQRRNAQTTQGNSTRRQPSSLDKYEGKIGDTSLAGDDNAPTREALVAVVNNADEREILEVLRNPVLWEFIFADSVLSSDPAPYGQLKLSVAERIVVSKVGPGAGRTFGVEELVDGVYVVGDTLEECLDPGADGHVVWTWLAEREEARAKEQGTHLGIVWASPPRL